MKDRKIGEIFDHPKLGKLIVTMEQDSTAECYGCVFATPLLCANDPDRFHTGECSAKMRIDKRNVIFIKSKI